MGEIVPLFDPYNKRRAQERIKKLIREGSIEILKHAQDEMAADGLDMLDVENVVRYGTITEVTRPKVLWRYRLEGEAVDKKKTACVFEINGRIILITVFSLRKRWRK